MFSSAMLAAEDPIDTKSERNIVSTPLIIVYVGAVHKLRNAKDESMGLLRYVIYERLLTRLQRIKSTLKKICIFSCLFAHFIASNEFRLFHYLSRFLTISTISSQQYSQLNWF